MMYGDYGYMEEGRLGKPHNLALIKRLLGWAAPYKGFILAALSASILGTFLSLAAPYATKVAIDRYIVGKWFRLDLTRPEAGKISPPKGSAASDDGKSLFIFHSRVASMGKDRADSLKRLGALSGKAYLRVPKKAFLESPLARAAWKGEAASGDFFFLDWERALAQGIQGAARLRQKDTRGVVAMGLFLLILAAGSFVLSYLETLWMEKAGQNTMADVRNALFTHMLTQGLAFYDRHPVGRLTTRATNDVENLNEMFKSVLSTVFKDVLILLGILVVLFFLDLKLALLCFALTPIVVAATFLFSFLAREAFRHLRTTVSKINSFCQERFSAMPTVQLFGVEEPTLSRFLEFNEENYQAGMRQLLVFSVFMPLMEFLATLGMALLILWGGRMVLSDRVTLGTLVAFLSYLRMFFRPLRDIAEKYNIMQAAMASMERIFEFMDAGEALPEGKNQAPAETIQGTVAFDGVSFSYNGIVNALEEVSFHIQPGRTLALVGRTGAGKSTLAHLLLRFYDPQKGRVSIDGVDVRDWPLAKLRKNVALAGQDVFLFSAGVLENITLGIPADLAEVREAARKAQALSFIEELPGGFSYKVSERGGNLSVGQRQLLSFARVLFYGSPVLVLDEATASVDPETERQIQKAIQALSQNRTTLVVAHRLSTIERSDRIVVLDKGRVREAGTHAELMEKKGHYFRLRSLLDEK